MGAQKAMKLEVEGYEAIEKRVKPGGNSGRVYVPIAWKGYRVKIILLEEIESDD